MTFENKGYSTPSFNPAQALMEFEVESFSQQLREYVTAYVDGEMKGKEKDLDHYRNVLMVTMNGLMNALGGHLIEMKIHAGAKVNHEFMAEMFSSLGETIMETVTHYEQTGKCPGCHSSH